jgi:hypothetical protein
MSLVAFAMTAAHLDCNAIMELVVLQNHIVSSLLEQHSTVATWHTAGWAETPPMLHARYRKRQLGQKQLRMALNHT